MNRNGGNCSPVTLFCKANDNNFTVQKRVFISLRVCLQQVFVFPASVKSNTTVSNISLESSYETRSMEVAIKCSYMSDVCMYVRVRVHMYVCICMYVHCSVT